MKFWSWNLILVCSSCPNKKPENALKSDKCQNLKKYHGILQILRISNDRHKGQIYFENFQHLSNIKTCSQHVNGTQTKQQ